MQTKLQQIEKVVRESEISFSNGRYYICKTSIPNQQGFYSKTCHSTTHNITLPLKDQSEETINFIHSIICK